MSEACCSGAGTSGDCCPDLSRTDPVDVAIEKTAAAARACRDQLRTEPTVQRLYRFVLRTFAETGRGPTREALTATAGELGIDGDHWLQLLAAMDLLVLGDDGEVVRAAYPFSATETPHRVRLDDGRELNAVCAIDALGIPAMLRCDAVIDSVEPGSGHPIRVTVAGPHTRWNPPDAVMLIVPIQGNHPAADCGCRDINFFTTRAAAQRWAGDRGVETFWILDQAQAARRASLVFAHVLESQ